MSAPSPLHVAVVGSGPSGFFAADTLLKNRDDVRVDLFDRLPTPYGLVRYGVAPDHQRIKSVTRAYERTCRDERVRFFGNVGFGDDLSLTDLRERYHAVVFTVGAASDRSLGIEGEDLEGSLSATEFVAWYNGHPDYSDLEPPLDAEAVAVVGMGNVAVDVTRILAKSVAELRETDIADHALAALERSAVTDIYMLGRRGPAQGKFTTKELRELGELANADVIVDAAELELDPASEASLEGDPMRTKNIEVLRDFAAREAEGKSRRIHLRFFVSPREIVGRDGRVAEVVLGRNRLEPQASGYIAAVDSGERERLAAQAVLRSVGYRGAPLPEVPFDARRGVIPNELGRVLDEAGGERLAGLYVAGWIKRGPSGVIGTNKADAMESVDALLADAGAGDLPEPASPGAVAPLLDARGVRYVRFEDWKALDDAEVEAGKDAGRPRVKVVDVEAMLEHRGAQREE